MLRPCLLTNHSLPLLQSEQVQGEQDQHIASVDGAAESLHIRVEVRCSLNCSQSACSSHTAASLTAADQEHEAVPGEANCKCHQDCADAAGQTQAACQKE